MRTKSFQYICLLMTICGLAATSLAMEPNQTFQNSLRPFSSDGCSSFPDGIPFFASTMWQQCCVVHDVAYWQGGTAKQRNDADIALGECVEKSGSSALGFLMTLGVRLGGYTGLPTSWRWGYGWSIDKGYKELSDHEKEQVQRLSAHIPKDLKQVKIVSPSAIPTRTSETGDYCLDKAVVSMYEFFGKEFEISKVRSKIEEGFEGWKKSLTITTPLCQAPFHFDFLLLAREACTTPLNELLARGRVRLKKITIPEDCKNK